jgi:hypothetical protein
MGMTGAEKQILHRNKVKMRIIALELSNKALVEENRVLTAEVKKLTRYVSYVRDYVRRNLPGAIDDEADAKADAGNNVTEVQAGT